MTAASGNLMNEVITMASPHNAARGQSPAPARPPACGNRMCDLCTEIRCRMLRQEETEPAGADRASENETTAKKPSDR